MSDCHLFKSLWSKEERQKKGPSLAYWFQQTMDSGDASNKEAPPSNFKRKDLIRKAYSKVTSMLVAMNTEDSLRQGAVMSITKRFGMACSTIY